SKRKLHTRRDETCEPRFNQKSRQPYVPHDTRNRKCGAQARRMKPDVPEREAQQSGSPPALLSLSLRQIRARCFQELPVLYTSRASLLASAATKTAVYMRAKGI